MGQFCRLLVVLLFLGYCLAGPIPEDVAEEATPDNVCEVKNVTFARGDVVPDVSPCETCVCEPPEVKCSPVKCPANNGCKIIQKSGKCCPEYKCDCEHEGTMYNNGEKLHNPASPCLVCYCRGGEIMCNSITCYRRDDCEPQHVEGQCCPKYGHCPPKNSSSVIAVPADQSGLSTKREMQPWLLTKSVNLQTTETPSKYPQTIKIVEILPTQAPTRHGEVSLVPRIVTNGPDRLMTSDASTSSYSDIRSSEASEPPKISVEPTNEDHYLQPDSETYTTLLPQMIDVTAAYEELVSLSSEATEGTGYDLESGGTFFPNSTKEDSSEEDGSGDSSEEKMSTTAIPLESEDPKDDVDEVFEPKNNTMNANLEIDTTTSDWNTESTETNSTLYEGEPIASNTSSKTDLMTRHGLTIPPILNLNHQYHHLTVGGTGEEAEDKSVVRIGVYNPTIPGEVSSMVTVLKNDDTAPSSATTQVLLTPQDLKTLAEMIIKEKIKSPNGKLELGTTPISIDDGDHTSPDNAYNTTLAIEESEETTPHSKVVGDKTLTKEEEKAQAVIDKLTSNLGMPLQGIELVDVNDTTTTEQVELLTLNTTAILDNKDAEWVAIANSSKGDGELDNSTVCDVDTTEPDTTERANKSSTEMRTTVKYDGTSSSQDVPTEQGKTRGSLRQMEDLISQLPDAHGADRQTRITTMDHSKNIMAMFDEKDQMLVENFFKKALDFQ